MNKLVLIFGTAIGVFTIYRVAVAYKYNIGQEVGVHYFSTYFNGIVENRKKNIIFNQYLIDGKWYEESLLSETLYS